MVASATRRFNVGDHAVVVARPICCPSRMTGTATRDAAAGATGAIVTHTYSVPGRFTAVVTVRDGRGATNTASIVIDAGNTAPSPSISSPSSTARFAVGQTITLRGAASDAEDGALPDANLSWRVILHHGTHTHPFLGPVSGNGVTFQAPAPAGKKTYLWIGSTDGRVKVFVNGKRFDEEEMARLHHVFSQVRDRRGTGRASTSARSSTARSATAK